jgi:hypothetical protein
MINDDFQSPDPSRALERLHIRWILLRNRPESQNLSASELIELLTHNKITWSDLTKKEQKSIQEYESASSLEKAEKTKVDIGSKQKGVENSNLVKSSYFVVQSLLLEMDKFKEKYYSQDTWNSYSSDQKRFARVEIFKQEFNTTPKEFGYLIYKSMA